MSELITITVDNKDIKVAPDALLIDVLKSNSVDIPHFCYHEDLGIDGNCRMCLVEIEGQKRPQIACDTVVTEGMSVKTKSEMTQGLRKSMLELELLHHPVDCPTCDQAGECSLQDYYMEYGLYDSRLKFSKNKKGKKMSLGSNVMLDQERCVLCTRCVRFFPKVTGEAPLGVFKRADGSRISTFPGSKLDSPYSMNVVDLCPVGALTSEDFRFEQRVWFLTSFEAICSGCSKGCNIHVDHTKLKDKDDEIFRFKPRRNVAINKSFMCDEGRLSYKKEKTNRLDQAVYNCDDTIESLVSNNNTVIVVSPMLSLEELEYLQNYATSIGATISGHSPQYIDEDFKDDILKTSDRSPNRKALEKLNIDCTQEHLMNSLDTRKVVIVCENSYFEENQELLENKKTIGLFSSLQRLKYDILEPIKSFYEKDGTYINCDGIEQSFTSNIDKNNPMQEIKEVLK